MSSQWLLVANDTLMMLWAAGWGAALTWSGVQPIFRLVEMITEDAGSAVRRHLNHRVQPGNCGGGGRGCDD